MKAEKIRTKLKFIQNRFNMMDLDDKWIEKEIEFILKNTDGNVRDEKTQEVDFRYICFEYFRKLVREYSHVVLAKNKAKKYYLFTKGKNTHKLYKCMELFAGMKEERLPMIYEAARSLNKIYSEKCIRGQVEFPTGEVLFSNYFRNASNDEYAFDIPKEVKYSEVNSINHSLGQQNTMKILSDAHGLGYVQLGNRIVNVYKVNDDKIVITNRFLDYYDKEKGVDETLDIPEGWECLGEIDCEVWRVEFIDKENFLKGNALPIDDEKYQWDNKPFIGKVNPGTWKITNNYLFMNDNKEMRQGRVPLWVELDRVKD